MKKAKNSVGKSISGAMTVEASLILPIFILLFMNLLSMIEVYRIHSSVAETLWEKGRESAKFLYAKEAAGNILPDSEEIDFSQIEMLLISLSGHGDIIEDLNSYPGWERMVTGGRGGFLVSGRTQEDGTIHIDCSYQIHPLFPSLTPVGKAVENHYYGHAWTGYVLGGDAGTEESEETYVYITETGTVYHKNRSCSYLNPSIHSIALDKVDDIRNKGGAVYYACPRCADMLAKGNCFVTDYGTNYHLGITCSALKRTIYEVKLSETGGRGACSKCGG